MEVRVELTQLAEGDIAAACAYLRAHSAPAAARWVRGLHQRIGSLAHLPERCPRIAEAEELGLPVRQLLYGQRTGTYRILFDVWEAHPQGPTVRVLRVWHGAREPLRITDLGADDPVL